jgi:hypothetical protein
MTGSDLPKIGAPATRALASIGVTMLAQVPERSEVELLAFHGFGPRALGIVREALGARGVAASLTAGSRLCRAARGLPPAARRAG